jgi:HEAT repeat protein
MGLHEEPFRMRLVIQLLIAALCVGSIEAAEIRPDFEMYKDPVLVMPQPYWAFSEEVLPLWIKALERPESDFQRLTAETIALAHAEGMPGLIGAAPRLVAILSAPDTHPAARFAAARALIAVEAVDEAPALYDATLKYGTDLRQIIEPALARWKFAPIREVWKQRLTDRTVRHRDLLLAIRGLGASEDDSSVPMLLTFVHDPFRTPSTRLAAARAAGALKTAGLEREAARLTNPSAAPVINRLCAAALLDRHAGESGRAALTVLAVDADPSVAAAALESLFAFDPDLVVPLAEQAMRNLDANVRRQGANAYIARPTPARIAPLALRLDDPHPAVRSTVRDALFDLAKDATLDGPIRTAAAGVLAGDGWRGHEQAALLLAALDEKSAAPRLVALLESTRGEVMVATAWALKKLAVPETLPAMLDKVARQTELRLQPKPVGLELDYQVAHLNEAMGQMKYAPSETLLRRYIPKNYAMGMPSRGAAIWSLGLLHNGVPDEALAELMVERLTEPGGAIPSEAMVVRVMSAVSIARMQVKSQIPRMLKYMGPKVDLVESSLAIRWAVHHMTGELMPGPERPIKSRSGWFLEPLDTKPLTLPKGE